ncbi:class I SAM-dependent methyltransferase [Clostridium saccharobutylicum]|uniref:Ribosomal RNA adenine dimethylase n=1 Tax=Clostridium saccharobutylicum DSM 13864 TaxID=1345695 RepID=U5MPA4_CLOSA|nr:rRNA adenine N-6-methyltransferase family protein [Clostridium saccharobutylicum]AGX42629.1 ribosomal RNA adenine dimethylase [Clostridium saccharobutylicum DSM 13864]AQR89916.1 ribosomal RNA small subunit methyltransferase A [Clostridium saccharobutylicum]AQR99821.1 ribosomal RNA small subunit methyltransferase A [Clostridium saccharobutylicum]AQS09549.1 ribosomal RNA small subunit methyltransferase A [Clostridium saccharobutylicum]AQS13805.1 ribosomal RNA small subunit methyltransferase A
MEISNFIKQYIKNPKTVGAIAPSSEKLAYKMVEDINFFNASCIVEYGPGTGIFTEKILNKKKDETIFIAIEYNPDFYKILKDKFKGETNFILINDSAENLKEYLTKYNIDKVDYIVSGLPFASLPDAMSKKILSITKEILKDKGEFITFQYTLFKMKLFKMYFNKIKRKKVLLNLPPTYVLMCKNLNQNTK